MRENKERDCLFIQLSDSQCGWAIRTKKYMYSVRTLAPTGYVAHNSDVYLEDIIYDLSVDPIEKNNLIKSPEYASVRAELKDMLINEMV